MILIILHSNNLDDFTLQFGHIRIHIIYSGVPKVEKIKLQSKVLAILDEYSALLDTIKKKEELKSKTPTEKVFIFNNCIF